MSLILSVKDNHPSLLAFDEMSLSTIIREITTAIIAPIIMSLNFFTTSHSPLSHVQQIIQNTVASKNQITAMFHLRISVQQLLICRLGEQSQRIVAEVLREEQLFESYLVLQ